MLLKQGKLSCHAANRQIQPQIRSDHTKRVLDTYTTQFPPTSHLQNPETVHGGESYATIVMYDA